MRCLEDIFVKFLVLCRQNINNLFIGIHNFPKQKWYLFKFYIHKQTIKISKNQPYIKGCNVNR